MSDAPLQIERLMDAAYVNLRGDPGSPEFVTAVRDACGIELPLTANTHSGTEPRTFWLGPNEWLIVGDSAEMAAVAAALSSALQGQYAAVNDLSGGYVTYRLSGADARGLLAKGCALDLHPGVFGAERCAQTGIAKAGVLLSPLSGKDGFDLIVRRSFADYLWQWLLQAGREFRIDVA